MYRYAMVSFISNDPPTRTVVSLITIINYINNNLAMSLEKKKKNVCIGSFFQLKNVFDQPTVVRNRVTEKVKRSQL